MVWYTLIYIAQLSQKTLIVLMHVLQEHSAVALVQFHSVWYGMVYVILYSTVVTKVSNALMY